jgi:hypothetical protein
MTEVDIPKRVVVVLLFLVILVSFLGTLTVLQMYATYPRGGDVDASRATVGLGLLPPWKVAEPNRTSDDSATVSIGIINNEG